MTLSVYAPGRLVDQEAYLVHAPSTGILNEWKIKEGDIVKPGQILAIIENSTAELNLDNARIRMGELRGDLDTDSPFREELNLVISNAELKYEDDKANYERQKNLWDNKVGTRRELEMKELAMKNSLQQLNSARNSAQLQLDKLEKQLKTAQNQYKISNKQNQDYQVESRIEGIFSKKLVQAGEWVAPQQPIGKLGGRDQFILELEVDEVDIVSIEVGQSVVISLDAYPDQVFTGTVDYLNTEKDDLGQSYKIEVVFKEKPPRLFVGMTAEANIILERKKDVLLIPQSYLIPPNQVLTTGGDTLTLEIGATDLEYCEVLSGLSAQTPILKPGS